MSDSSAEQFVPANTTDSEPVVTDQLLTPEFLRSNICHIAGNLMADDSLVTIKTIGDRKYRVSKGNEHFVFNQQGIANYNNPDGDISGFQLFQEVRKKDQKLKEILIVKDGIVKSPLARILSNSESVNAGLSIEMLGDPDALGDCLTIVASIDKDSREKSSAEISARKHKRKRIVRRAIGAIVTTATLTTVGWLAYDEGGEYLKDRSEQQAQDKKDRESEIAEFDSSFDIESETAISTESIHSVDHSDQFADQTVPKYNDETVSRSIAEDLSEPRSFELELDDEGCQLLDADLDSKSDYRVIHDGDPDKLYNVLLSARENLITVCNSKNFPGQADLKEAQTLVVQEAVANR